MELKEFVTHSILDISEATPNSSKTRKQKDAHTRKISTENKGWTSDDVPDNFFKGKTMVITGVLQLLGERDPVAGLLKSLGARVTSSISTKTQIIVTGQDPGPSKLEKAAQLRCEGVDIQIMGELELILKLHDDKVDLLSFVAAQLQ